MDSKQPSEIEYYKERLKIAEDINSTLVRENRKLKKRLRRAKRKYDNLERNTLHRGENNPTEEDYAFLEKCKKKQEKTALEYACKKIEKELEEPIEQEL